MQMNSNDSTMKRVRMKDIAAATGLSQSTVSLALRGDARIAAATRAKVEQTADALGYRPDPALSALAEERWRAGPRRTGVNLGLLSWEGSEAALCARREYRILREKAEAIGYALIPLAVSEERDLTGLNHRLHDLTIRGVIVDEQHWTPSLDWDRIRWELAAWVAIREGNGFPAVHRVLENSFRGTCCALERIREAGFRRILFLHEPFTRARVLHRQQAGFLLTRAQWPDTAWAECEIVDAGKAIAEFRPDALLTAYPDAGLAFGPPNRLPFASLGLKPEEGDRGISGMLHDPDYRAETVIHFLDALARRGHHGLPERRESLMLDMVWLDGETLSPGVGPPSSPPST